MQICLDIYFLNYIFLRFCIESSACPGDYSDKYLSNRLFLYLNICFDGNIQPAEKLCFRCPLTTAPVRSAGFFSSPDGCNIASGTDPATGAVKEGFRNFRQQFFVAAFSHRQMGASCVFVRQPSGCPTKTLALRGRGRSQVATLYLAIYGYQPKTDRQDRQEAPNAEL